jgi:hypothetical protein
MFMVAVHVPVTCGVNVTLMVQLEFAGTLPLGKLQVLVWLQQAPVPLTKFMLLIASATDPAFWKVTFSGALDDPTVVVGNVNVRGETFTAVPFPLINVPASPTVQLPE